MAIASAPPATPLERLKDWADKATLSDGEAREYEKRYQLDRTAALTRDTPEFELAVGTSFHLEAVLVHRAVVTAAQRGEVGQRRRPAAGPVPNVVALRETAAAAGEATATVSVIQRPA